MNQYIEILGLLHPGIEAHAKGPDYSDIVWKNAKIAKAALDAEIPNISRHRVADRAGLALDMAINKALRNLLFDIESRLRAVGQTSTLVNIAAAGNQAEYRAALKDIVESHL